MPSTVGITVRAWRKATPARFVAAVLGASSLRGVLARAATAPPPGGFNSGGPDYRAVVLGTLLGRSRVPDGRQRHHDA